MNTLEAMVAVMMVLAIVAIVMDAHSRAAEGLGGEALRERMERGTRAVQEQAVAALGKGRSANSSVFPSYGRWYIGEQGAGLDD
ncbi:MAG: hypothetical protein KAW41_06625 [Candidatus Diapherotrites archaeon]|nr:hypothetical protein [Candidatus Diapherotrites archaeon]